MRETFLSIQYLRAIAALLVVLHHTRNPHTWLFNPLSEFQGFTVGVDIFFVISGFIMASIGAKERPLVFAQKRLIRVAPIYWLACATVFLLSIQSEGSSATLTQHFLKSIFFVPHLNPNGEPFPILIPGWTLNYEMFFYGLFFLGLLARAPIQLTLVAILCLVLLGQVHSSSNLLYTTYTNTLLSEFAAGLLIGKYRSRIAATKWVGLLVPIGFAFLFLTTHWTLATAGASAVVGGLVSIEKSIPNMRGMALLGDASYAIYITHHFTLSKILKIWRGIPLQEDVQFWGLVVTSLLICSAVGLVVHKLIEKPMTQYLNQIAKGFNRQMSRQ
jgi:exopolysaccharide production protein ExoZ